MMQSHPSIPLQPNDDSTPPPSLTRKRKLAAVVVRSMESTTPQLADLADLGAAAATPPPPPKTARSTSTTETTCALSLPPPHTFRLDCRDDSPRHNHHNIKASNSAGLPLPMEDDRVLIFRSDRVGAVAKLVFSSSESTSIPPPSVAQLDDGALSTGSSETEEEKSIANCCCCCAKIHCLECKPLCRGFDFGGLLFTKAVQLIRNVASPPLSSVSSSSPVSVVRCQLEAEEDERRFGRLVGFYEELGCSVKEKSKIQVMNTNNGETYRKVPMYLDVAVHDGKQQHFSRRRDIFNRMDHFLPVVFLTDEGQLGGVAAAAAHSFHANHRQRRNHWLLVQNEDNAIEICTTVGNPLLVDSLGFCELHQNSGDSCTTSPCKFQLFRAVDEFERDPQFCGGKAVSPSLWMIQSVEFDTYLTLAQHGDVALLQCVRTPTFWYTGPSYSLVSTTDTPQLRRHYWMQWQTQSVAYVSAMKERYLRFDHKHMTLKDALDCGESISADPWSTQSENNGTPTRVSLRTLCFQTAEWFRDMGHPDWVQLLALVYGLGRVATTFDVKGSDFDKSVTYDWTICSRSRVLGCPVPTQAQFGELQCLSPDFDNAAHNSKGTGLYERHGGLDNCLLSWTGPEYMYHMLRHNQVELPNVAFKMLRLSSLSDWHTLSTKSSSGTSRGEHAGYREICNDEDNSVRTIVSDFDFSMQRARRSCLTNKSEMTRKHCDSLWAAHYSDIASKYKFHSLDGLEW